MKGHLAGVVLTILAAGVPGSRLDGDRESATQAQAGIVTTGKKESRVEADIKSAPNNDDLAQARALNQTIDEHALKVETSRKAMTDTAMTAAPMLDQIRVVSELENLAALRPVIADLRERSRAILEKKADFETYLGELRSDLAMAPEVFRKAGAVYRTYAETESYEDIKEDYLMLASTWDRLAEAVKSNETQVATESAEVTDLLKYLGRIDLFLQRLDQHLASFPSTGGITQWKEHLDELKEYAKKFEELRSSLNGIHERVRGIAPATTPAAGATTTSSPTLYRYAITPADNGRSRITLPRVNALVAGDKVAVFRENHRLAGWATIEMSEESSPAAIAKTDVVLATGDYVALSNAK